MEYMPNTFTQSFAQHRYYFYKNIHKSLTTNYDSYRLQIEVNMKFGIYAQWHDTACNF